MVRHNRRVRGLRFGVEAGRIGPMKVTGGVEKVYNRN